MKSKCVAIFFLLIASSIFAQSDEPFHRADSDKEIIYWMLDPTTHQFRFSHDFNITRAGQKYAHSFVRKGSTVSDDIAFIDLDSGQKLKTKKVTGREVNELGYYAEKSDPEDVVVQGELLNAVPEGGSVRIRVMETYTDKERYSVDQKGLLVWDRTFGRAWNQLTLPEGWMLVDCNVPATIEEDDKGRIVLGLNNPRNDELHVIVHARKRK